MVAAVSPDRMSLAISGVTVVAEDLDLGALLLDDGGRTFGRGVACGHPRPAVPATPPGVPGWSSTLNSCRGSIEPARPATHRVFPIGCRSAGGVGGKVSPCADIR